MPSESTRFDDVFAVFRRSAAPYVQHVAVNKLDKAASPFVDPASLGLYVSVISLAVSLFFGVRAEIRAGRAEEAARAPDFAALLSQLRSGRKTPEDVLAVLRAWRPDLTPIEVAALIREGAREDLEELLAELGLPLKIAALMIMDIEDELGD